MLSRKEYACALLQVMRTGDWDLLPVLPKSYRTAPIDNELMLTQRQEAQRKIEAQHFGGGPIRNAISKQQKQQREEAIRRLRKVIRGRKRKGRVLASGLNGHLTVAGQRLAVSAWEARP